MRKVKHAVERAGDRIKRAPADPFTVEESVFNESQNRSLIGEAVVDVVTARIGGDDQQWQAGTVAASSLGRRPARGGRSRRLRIDWVRLGHPPCRSTGWQSAPSDGRTSRRSRHTQQ